MRKRGRSAERCWRYALKPVQVAGARLAFCAAAPPDTRACLAPRLLRPARRAMPRVARTELLGNDVLRRG